MTRGGHNRSGPTKDPNSLRSMRAGVTLVMLPSEGHDGEAPRFPLPDVTFHETSLWTWAWKQPQAVAWACEEWRWPIVAMWVRTFVRCSAENAKTAEVNSLHRLADQIGMTPAGLRENGWAIVRDAVAGKREDKAQEPAQPAASAKDRFKLLTGEGAG